ncbi:MAG: DUF1995 family protein [Leptolyngbyaceae cyanobacterium SL_7_1]|nr:DUF1995 family protein [Leptolyngbyaceae cyanobacterium SL_7_1]
MVQLPQTLEQAVEQAQAATKAAIADGLTRLQVELVFPELKVMPIAQQFVTAFEDQAETLRVFFADPGAAALARRDWGEVAYPMRGIGELKATIEPHERLFLFIAPSSVEVGQVEQLCEQVGDRPVVLFNPQLEDVAIIGIGYAGRQLRERFLNQFQACYYLRPLEGAALLRCYPSPWQVWIERLEGTYELVAEVEEKPVGEALDRLLSQQATQHLSDQSSKQSPRRSGMFASLKSFLRALNQ